MRFRAGCELHYALESESAFVFHIAVAAAGAQRCLEESLRLDPERPYEDRRLPGSDRRYLHLSAGPGPLALRYEATVERTPVWDAVEQAAEAHPTQLPLEALPYLLPSRYCPSDLLVPLAEKEFGGIAPGFTRVTAICNWIYERLDYVPGASDSGTSAIDTLIRRAGVCRDYAHLGVSLCRALNIPARYLSAYAWGLAHPDFHACFEAFLGGRWYLFDATRLAPLPGFIRIGDGRDAADVSFATYYGAARLESMETFIEVLPGPGGEPETPAWTTLPLVSA